MNTHSNASLHLNNHHQPLWQELDTALGNTLCADLSDLMVWDFTEPMWIRQGYVIQEFDIISLLCDDGFYRTGYVLGWDDASVTIEVSGIEHTARRNDDEIELVAMAESSKWESEYNEYLDKLAHWVDVAAEAEEALQGAA